MQFFEPTHKYFKNSKDDAFNYLSASGIVKRYEKEFNALYWSLYKAYEFLLYRYNKDSTLHIDEYLEKKPTEPKEYFKQYRQGYSFEDNSLFDKLRFYVDEKEALKVQKYILEEWRINNEKSLTKGNILHNYKEYEAISNKQYTNPFTNNILPVIKHYDWDEVTNIKKSLLDLNNLSTGYYPELILYYTILDNNGEELTILGQADKVFIEENKFYIDDFKSNKEIKFENNFQKMLDPISHLDNCNFNHYKLQLSIYSWILIQYGYEYAGSQITHYQNKIHRDIIISKDSIGNEQKDWNIEVYKFSYLENEMNDIINDLKNYKV